MVAKESASERMIKTPDHYKKEIERSYIEKFKSENRGKLPKGRSQIEKKKIERCIEDELKMCKGISSGNITS